MNVSFAKLPQSVQKHYPDQSKISGIDLSDNEVGGETYTVVLTSGRVDKWQRVTYFWKLVNQSVTSRARVRP